MVAEMYVNSLPQLLWELFLPFPFLLEYFTLFYKKLWIASGFAESPKFGVSNMVEH